MINFWDIRNYQELGSGDMIIARFKACADTCAKCQQTEIKAKEIVEKRVFGKIILLEVEKDSLSHYEKTETKLREVAKQWTYFNYVICHPFALHLKSQARFQDDKEFLKGFEASVEGRPPSDFIK